MWESISMENYFDQIEIEKTKSEFRKWAQNRELKNNNIGELLTLDFKFDPYRYQRRIYDESKIDKLVVQRDDKGRPLTNDNFIIKQILNQRNETRKRVKAKLSSVQKFKVFPAKIISNGQTSFCLKQPNRDEIVSQLLQQKNNNKKQIISRVSEYETRLEMIDWIRSEQIKFMNQICQNKTAILEIFKLISYASKAELLQILYYFDIHLDKVAFERFYWIIDYDQDGTIQSGEIMIAIGIFGEFLNFQDKCDYVFKLMDVNDNHYIDQQEFKQFLINCLKKQKEIDILDKYIKKLFHMIVDEHKSQFQITDFKNACEKQTILQDIVEKIIKFFTKKTKSTFEGKYLKPMKMTNTNGDFLPYLNRIQEIDYNLFKKHQSLKSIKSVLQLSLNIFNDKQKEDEKI